MLGLRRLLFHFGRMKINPNICSAAGCFVVLATVFFNSDCRATDATNQWNVQVVGVMVVSPEGGKDNRAFCWKPGVTVSAVFSPVAGKIVSLKESDSKIISFRDDQGTDLMAATPSQDPFNKPGISCAPASVEGGVSSVNIDLKASGQPAKGAAGLNISGMVSAEIADFTKQFTVENVEIKTNATFSLGDLPVVISNVGTNRNPWMAKDYKYSVTFSSLRNLASISNLEFFDAQGNKIEAQKSAWGDGFLGYMAEYILKQNVDHAKIVATCWQNLKTVEVPFSIKTGIGL
jgi:hypothetical protein